MRSIAFLSPSSSRRSVRKPIFCSNRCGAIPARRLSPAPTYALRRGDDPVVVALAADHVVTDPLAFAKVCATAGEAAHDDQIVMFGVQPTRAGNRIRLHPSRRRHSRPGCSASNGLSKSPMPKPRHAMWPKAICGTPATSCFAPTFCSKNIAASSRTAPPPSRRRSKTAGTDLGFVTLEAEAFGRATAKSIDYAVMERTERAAVMPVSYGWSDVGSWQAVWELSERDADGNAAQGTAVFVDARGSYVASEKQLVALLGVDNVVVVTTDDAVLVARREDGDGLRQVVERLRQVAPALTQDHLKVHRPWGSYQSLDLGERYQVKRIVVKQGGRLSLQLHHHRAEHWVVVRGTARVTIGDKVQMLHENESIYVPIGTRHRLENPGKIDLELIEVQTGSYLGEDDIERIEDDYHRS